MYLNKFSIDQHSDNRQIIDYDSDNNNNKSTKLYWNSDVTPTA